MDTPGKADKQEKSIQVGDSVSVKLPNGLFFGKVMSVKNNYGFTGDVWFEVSGSKPNPFYTIARYSSVKRLSITLDLSG